MRLITAMQFDPRAGPWYRPGVLGRAFDLEPFQAREELVVGSSLDVLEEFVRAFRTMKASQVISLQVDDDSLLEDCALADEELEALVAAIEQRPGLLDQPFHRIRLDVERMTPDLHLVAGATIAGEARIGEPDAELAVSARIRELEAERDECAADFADRVRTFLSLEGAVATAVERVEAFADGLLDELTGSTDASGAYFGRPEVSLRRPNKADLQALGRAPFADLEISRRAVASGARGDGWTQDRYGRWYVDPYDVLVDLLALDAALAGRARGLPPDTTILSADGRKLGTVATIDDLAERELASVPALVSDTALAAYDDGHVPTH